MKKMYKIDWTEIQTKYDSGIATRHLVKEYKLSCQMFSDASKAGLFKPRSKAEATKMYHKLNPGATKHSDESKLKISKARKAYLYANPDKVPYLLNHKHKRKFYSEIYFGECFRNTNIISEYKVRAYSLDFADVEKKIDIEIDGDQHFLDKRIVEHDIRRNEYLLSLGWTIIRIRWSKFQKLSPPEKLQLVKSIIEYKNPNNDCVTFLSN